MFFCGIKAKKTAIDCSFLLNQNHENKGNDRQLTKLLIDKQIICQYLRKCIETSMPVEYAY